MFRMVFHPSSGAHNTVSTASGWKGTAVPAQSRSRQVAVEVSLILDTVNTVI